MSQDRMRRPFRSATNSCHPSVTERGSAQTQPDHPEADQADGAAAHVLEQRRGTRSRATEHVIDHRSDRRTKHRDGYMRHCQHEGDQERTPHREPRGGDLFPLSSGLPGLPHVPAGQGLHDVPDPNRVRHGRGAQPRWDLCRDWHPGMTGAQGLIKPRNVASLKCSFPVTDARSSSSASTWLMSAVPIRILRETSSSLWADAAAAVGVISVAAISRRVAPVKLQSEIEPCMLFGRKGIAVSATSP